MNRFHNCSVMNCARFGLLDFFFLDVLYGDTSEYFLTACVYNDDDDDDDDDDCIFTSFSFSFAVVDK